MVQNEISFATSDTITVKGYEYHEYYIGEKDVDNVREGTGENRWNGPKSIEWYSGQFIRDTMHGLGEYRWRYYGQEGRFITYEGNFYVNNMHGYGTMSYPDGRQFKGLFHTNHRWGPGILSFSNLHEDVGLWFGDQLVRLIWRPPGCVVPDLLSSPAGRTFVEPHRVQLASTDRIIGKTNFALELLKQCGADPMLASQKWPLLYPKNCNDLKSVLCDVDLFDRTYYSDKVSSLEIVDTPDNFVREDRSSNDSQDVEETKKFYAWNNSNTIIEMMKHSYKHDVQRNDVEYFDVYSLLTGPRKNFKNAGRLELDCRSLIMASYVGNIAEVTNLINKRNVHPDVADIIGNTALMYAASGDQPRVINFLAEAGATVDSYNDSCCTPLGVVLLRYAAARLDIMMPNIVAALLPPPVVPPSRPSEESKTTEWCMTRDMPLPLQPRPIKRLAKSTSKLGKSQSMKKMKSLTTMSKTQMTKKKFDQISIKVQPDAGSSTESYLEERETYNSIMESFEDKIYEDSQTATGVMTPLYMFHVNDMLKEIEEEEKKVPEKNLKKLLSNVFKEQMKPSKEVIFKSLDRIQSSTIAEKNKAERISRIKETMLQLIANGADPNLVECPQPAVWIAMVSGDDEILRLLIERGAQVNKVIYEPLGYTPLDVVFSRPLTLENFKLVKTLLECGAIANHRLKYEEEAHPDSDIPGPTLLHALLAKKTESEQEEQIRAQTLELLLDHNCNALEQFKGRSVVDIAMNKSTALLDIIAANPNTDLNGIINDCSQTILLKMFTPAYFKMLASAQRLQMLTNLMLFGADPFLECQNKEEFYQNLFVYVRQLLIEMESMQKPKDANKDVKASKSKKIEEKPKKAEEKPKKSDPKKGGAPSSTGSNKVDDVAEYRQALELVADCARMLRVRWTQATLMRELVVIVNRYKHRHWNVIVKEHKQRKQCSLWLTPQRCLEIWDILKSTGKKQYIDDRVLELVLCIVLCYNIHGKTKCLKLKFLEKEFIDTKIKGLLRDQKNAAIMLLSGMEIRQRPYVKPELLHSGKTKFNVCFECFLPFRSFNEEGEPTEPIRCGLCRLVSFCGMDCLRASVERTSSHPCSDYLKARYCPTPPQSDTEVVEPSQVLMKAVSTA